MTEYDKGETVVISCEIKDESGEYTSPDEVLVTILRNSTTLVAETSMTEDATGKFHYDYLTTLAGRHDIWIKAETTTVPERVTIKPDTFEVISSY